VKEMGLVGMISGQQAAKKWENLKQRYRVCDVVVKKKLYIFTIQGNELPEQGIPSLPSRSSLPSAPPFLSSSIACTSSARCFLMSNCIYCHTRGLLYIACSLTFLVGHFGQKCLLNNLSMHTLVV
jgi:hypothetical protein